MGYNYIYIYFEVLSHDQSVVQWLQGKSESGWQCFTPTLHSLGRGVNNKTRCISVFQAEIIFLVFQFSEFIFYERYQLDRIGEQSSINTTATNSVGFPTLSRQWTSICFNAYQRDSLSGLRSQFSLLTYSDLVKTDIKSLQKLLSQWEQNPAHQNHFHIGCQKLLATTHMGRIQTGKLQVKAVTDKVEHPLLDTHQTSVKGSIC